MLTVKLKGFKEVELAGISRQSGHESGNVFSPTHRPSLPLQKILLVLIYVIA